MISRAFNFPRTSPQHMISSSSENSDVFGFAYKFFHFCTGNISAMFGWSFSDENSNFFSVIFSKERAHPILVARYKEPPWYLRFSVPLPFGIRERRNMPPSSPSRKTARCRTCRWKPYRTITISRCRTCWAACPEYRRMSGFTWMQMAECSMTATCSDSDTSHVSHTRKALSTECENRNFDRSKKIMQPSGAATPRNSDTHKHVAVPKAFWVLLEHTGPRPKSGKVRRSDTRPGEVCERAVCVKGSDTTPIRNAPVSACEPLCAIL